MLSDLVKPSESPCAQPAARPNASRKATAVSRCEKVFLLHAWSTAIQQKEKHSNCTDRKNLQEHKEASPPSRDPTSFCDCAEIRAVMPVSGWAYCAYVSAFSVDSFFRGSYPAQRRTGRRGYLGKVASVSESLQ